jgi:hypothetical protein
LLQHSRAAEFRRKIRRENQNFRFAVAQSFIWLAPEFPPYKPYNRYRPKFWRPHHAVVPYIKERGAVFGCFIVRI